MVHAEGEDSLKGWPVFFAAPHRVMFFGGIVQGLLAMLWWAASIGARHAGLFSAAVWVPNPPAYLPAQWMHGLLMIYGFFPFFIFGFLITAAPRWQGAPQVRVRVYAASFLLSLTGWLGVDAGLFLPVLLPVGLALALSGWLIAAYALLEVARHANPERRHVWVVAIALGLGASGLAAFLTYVVGGPGPVWLVEWALMIGLWGFLLPVFVTVAHRMLPFFSSSVIPEYLLRRPYWALWLLLTAFVAHIILALAGQAHWQWLVDLPAALIALYLSAIWQFHRSLTTPILAVLHIGFAWLSVALTLYAVQSLAALAGYGILGLAPLHALTLGFFTSMLLGMVSRVTLGHSGRNVAADAAMWLAFWGMQLTAVLRIIAELPAECCSGPGPFNLMWLAALCWLAAFGGWSLRYAPAYWRARVDGKPG
ncbi:MAG: NnrS family protein [Betaproteobacteria bacterium]|nr:NnrS family protein [Betaproteobacteria bacterium]